MEEIKQPHLHYNKFHHHLSHLLKITILILLTIAATIPLIYLLDSPQVILQKTIQYHPLFTYFQWEFKSNNLNHRNFVKEIFQLKKDIKPKYHKQLKKGRINNEKQFNHLQKYHSPNFINIVYHNASQSHHFDNQLFLAEYISFLFNKHNPIIYKKIITKKFSQLYKRFKYLTQTSKQSQNAIKIDKNIAKRNQEMFFKFSQKFQEMIDNQAVQVRDLEGKTILKQIKDQLESYMQKLSEMIRWFPFPTDNKQQKSKQKNKKSNQQKQSLKLKIFQQPETWIILLFHLQGQSLKQQQKYLSRLLKLHPQDKFIILTLEQPIFFSKAQTKIIPYFPSYPKPSFNKLFKFYLNTTETQSKIISQHYEYSLLNLKPFIRDQQTFLLYNLVGGRLGYSDLSSIPQIFLSRVQQLCQKYHHLSPLFSQKRLQEEEKIQFYRIGIYKLGQQILWKNKFAKMNYQFQMGRTCKKIPIFHSNYERIIYSMGNEYFDTISNIFVDQKEERDNQSQNQKQTVGKYKYKSSKTQPAIKEKIIISQKSKNKQKILNSQAELKDIKIKDQKFEQFVNQNISDQQSIEQLSKKIPTSPIRNKNQKVKFPSKTNTKSIKSHNKIRQSNSNNN